MKLLAEIEDLAVKSGAAVMDVYERKSIKKSFKKDSSPLTIADEISNKIITDALSRSFPDIPFLSEESKSNFFCPNDDSLFWLIDPLDGTKEFIKKNGEFTINIALIKSGKPILGVVYAPAMKSNYSAASGFGAFKTDSNGSRSPIKVGKSYQGSDYTVLVSRSHRNSISDVLSKLYKYQLLEIGSSLKFCLIAEGNADIYIRSGSTCFWDTAASQCILEEAGGCIYDFNGYSLEYSQLDTLINPSFIASAKDIKKYVLSLL
jgi:3'(2'), 5'-bisphosphate nucleotidase